MLAEEVREFAKGMWPQDAMCPSIERWATEIERLEQIEATARELVGPEGMRVTMTDKHVLAVIEKSDKSDPHYRLCSLLGPMLPQRRAALGRGL